MPPYLRHLHRHLEEPVGGVRRTFPISPIRQVRLAPDRVDALDPVRVQVRRPCDLRNAAHKLNHNDILTLPNKKSITFNVLTPS